MIYATEFNVHEPTDQQELLIKNSNGSYVLATYIKEYTEFYINQHEWYYLHEVSHWISFN